MRVVRENDYERMLRGRGEARCEYSRHENMGQKVGRCMHLSDGCKKKKIIKSRIVECNVSILRKSIVGVQKKSGPATPPASVTMRTVITKPALAGL